MKLKIVKIYIVLVLILVSTFPAFYFLLPSFSDISKIKPVSYKGDYLFYKSEDDVELFSRFYKNESSDKLIIFLPDGPGKVDKAFEYFLADSLQEKASLLLPDYRGVGKSERSKSTSFYHLDNYVNDLQTHIDKNAKPSILIVSHGFGTLVSQQYFTKYKPSNVKQILISPQVNFQLAAKKGAAAIAKKFKIENESKQVPAYFEMHGYAIDDEDVGFFGASKILALMDFYKVNFYDTLNAYYVLPDNIVEDGVYSSDELFSINLPSVTIGLTYSLYKSDLSSYFNDLDSRTLIVFGENDAMSWYDYFKNNFMNNEIKLINNSGYYPFIEQPNSILSIIREQL